MRFNYWIGFMEETYLFLGVCCGLNLLFYCRWDTIGNSINSLLAIVFSAFIILYPVFVAVFYSRPANYERIMNYDKEFLARFGSAIEGLNFKRQEKKVLVYLFFTILRRLWLAHIVVFQQENEVFAIF